MYFYLRFFLNLEIFLKVQSFSSLSFGDVEVVYQTCLSRNLVLEKNVFPQNTEYDVTFHRSLQGQEMVQKPSPLIFFFRGGRDCCQFCNLLCYCCSFILSVLCLLVFIIILIKLIYFLVSSSRSRRIIENICSQFKIKIQVSSHDSSIYEFTMLLCILMGIVTVSFVIVGFI